MDIDNTVEAVEREKPVRPSEALRLRPDCFLALAMADDEELGRQLKAWVKQVNWSEFDKLDYVKLMD